MRKTLYLCIFLLTAAFAHAQFAIEKTDGTVLTLDGNAAFETTGENSWSVATTDLTQITAISRVPRTGAIQLDREAIIGGELWNQYFGDSYESIAGMGDYYFCISNDDFAGVGPSLVPAHIGGYCVYLDMYAPISEDHNNPILPEGTYTVQTSKNQYVCGYYSFACLNTDGTAAGLKEIFFASGTVEVKHTADGYDITGNILTDDDETFQFHYAGTLSFKDLTGIDDSEIEKYLREDCNVEPQQIYDALYLNTSTDTYDDHLIRLFTTTDNDGLHCQSAGIKLEISLLSAKGQLEGTYTIGEMDGWSLKDPQAGIFYPGRYVGILPMGTFCEKVTDDLKVQTAVVNGGTLTIVKNDDDTYTITADFTTRVPVSTNTYHLTCTWTGQINTVSIDPTTEAPAATATKAPVRHRGL